MLPSSNELVAQALRELAEAHRQWRHSCQVDDLESEPSDAAYARNKNAEVRILELALSLYPSPVTRRAARQAPAKRAPIKEEA